MDRSREKVTIIIAGLIIGVVASVLVLLGNPANMGFCIACFIRDTAGALGACSGIWPHIVVVLQGVHLGVCRSTVFYISMKFHTSQQNE